MNSTPLFPQRYYLRNLFKPKKSSNLLLFLAISLSVSSTSLAQTRYYVNQSVSASGNGKSWDAAFKTLSEAIKVASSNVTDEIWVAKGTYIPNTNQYGTIYEPPSGSKNMAFYLKKPMKIYGGFIGTENALAQRNWETNETILSGNINDPADSTDNIYHVILILGTEASTLENVTVDGFTIKDGYANVFTDITIDGNVVYAYNGGGIYNIYSSPLLSNLKIVRNVGFVGGGIHNRYSSPVINNCQIIQNYSGSSGGGVHNLGGNPLIQNTLIADNRVNNIGGGGIDNSSSNVTVKNSIIRNNKANRGGGIYSDGGNVILEDVIIENNNAKTDGGGMYNFSETNIKMNQVTLTGNDASFGGGMRSFRAFLQIDSSQISKNIADNYGGGIYSDGDSLTISYSNIDSNKTIFYQGGGLFVERAVVNFKGGTIKGNKAKTDAGGILFRDDTHGTIEDMVISKNISPRYGGGIYLFGNSASGKQFHFKNVVFSENEAYQGGGIHLNSTSPTFDSVSFIGNITIDAGAGLIASAGAYPTLSNSRFEKNKAATGGGMFSQNGAGATMNNVSFFENEAANYGGGFYCGGTGNFNVINLKGNKAANGGGAYLAGLVNLTNAMITGNYASEKGGGVHIYYSAPVLTNNTVAGNNALQEGGGIYVSSSNNSQIRNSIIYGNSTGLGGYSKLLYSLVEGKNDATNGNIPGTTDPRFVEPYSYTTAPFITGNYAINATSPVINKGSNSYYQQGSDPDLSAIDKDVLGNPRFVNTIIDMGAIEYNASLPLKLVSFEVFLKNNTVNVSWITMEEINVSHFEIERSKDGISFEKVGIQEANGGGSYQFNDITLPLGSIYYRLKVIDNDGKFDYSNVKVVNVLNLIASKIILYPIPSKGLVYISDKNKTPLKGLFTVLTADGKTITQTKTNPVDIHALLPGMYYIKVVDETGKLLGTQPVMR